VKTQIHTILFDTHNEDEPPEKRKTIILLHLVVKPGFSQ